MIISIFEFWFDGIAHLISDGVELFRHSWDFSAWMVDLLTILDEHSSNFVEITVIGTIVGNELCYNSEWFHGINREIWTRSIEVCHIGSVGI